MNMLVPRITALVPNLLALFVLCACGGAGSDECPADACRHAPIRISNLVYSPHGADLDSGGGVVSVVGSVDYSAPGADVSSVNITVIDPAGRNIGTTTSMVQGAAGKPHGTILLQGSATMSFPGKYTLVVVVIGSDARASNSLSGDFTVVLPPRATWVPGPSISGTGALAVDKVGERCVAAMNARFNCGRQT